MTALDDLAPDSSDRRGSDGAPPYGRRRDDEHAQAILEEVRGLHTDVKKMAGEVKRAVEAVRPWTFKRVVAFGSTLLVAFSLVSGLLIWLGGGILGPGAKFEEYRRAQVRADSIGGLERAALLNFAESINGSLARQGYDMCVGVHRKPERECFDAYISQANRRVLPPVR